MPRSDGSVNKHLNLANQEPGEATLTASDVRRLLEICAEMIELCSKATGRINPALATLMEYAQDEALGSRFGLDEPTARRKADVTPSSEAKSAGRQKALLHHSA